tara:strand:+ start:324 stop:530 length:207 start_codon:yes stop_codon:yes gene_type:complete
MTELCYPSVDTWFICWDENRTEIKSYGGILTNQCMDSYWEEVDFYTDEAVWLAILLENGIDPNELKEN